MPRRRRGGELRDAAANEWARIGDGCVDIVARKCVAAKERAERRGADRGRFVAKTQTSLLDVAAHTRERDRHAAFICLAARRDLTHPCKAKTMTGRALLICDYCDTLSVVAAPSILLSSE